MFPPHVEVFGCRYDEARGTGSSAREEQQGPSHAARQEQLPALQTPFSEQSRSLLHVGAQGTSLMRSAEDDEAASVRARPASTASRRGILAFSARARVLGVAVCEEDFVQGVPVVAAVPGDAVRLAVLLGA
jgi:hypothetical protein